MNYLYDKGVYSEASQLSKIKMFRRGSWLSGKFTDKHLWLSQFLKSCLFNLTFMEQYSNVLPPPYVSVLFEHKYAQI